MKTLKTISLLTVVFFMISAFTVNNVTTEVNGYEVGDIATDFKLKNIDGNMVSLADYIEAKGFIVIFTCNTCPYAVKY